MDKSYGQKFVDFIAKTYGLESLPVARMTPETKKELSGAVGAYTGTTMELLGVDKEVTRTVLHELCHKFIDGLMNRRPGIEEAIILDMLNTLWPEGIPDPSASIWTKRSDIIGEALNELEVVECVERLSGSSEAGYRLHQMDRLDNIGDEIGKSNLGLVSLKTVEHFVDKLNLKKGPCIETVWLQFKRAHPNGTASKWELKKAELEEQQALGQAIFEREEKMQRRKHPERYITISKKSTTPAITTLRKYNG